MKQSFLFVMLCQCLLSSAQKKNDPWVFFTSLEVNQLRTLGGSFSIHPSLGKHFSIGAGIDLIRVRDKSKNVVPVYLDTRFDFQLMNLQPFVFLQGGLPAYNELVSGSSNTTRTELKGRSFLGSGVGFSVGKPTAKVRPFWSFKYRVYQFAEVFTQTGERPQIMARSEREQFTFSLGIQY
jgi:hypothetical protein